MPYVIDRQRALWTHDVVAILNARRQRSRSIVVSRENSLYHTLTRPRTLMQRTEDAERRTQGAQWRSVQ